MTIATILRFMDGFNRGVRGMQHGGQPVAEAAQATIDDVGSLGGTGGVITIDREGNIALPFNTAGMYRAWHTSAGGSGTAIYRE